MPSPDYRMLDWSDRQLDDLFLRSEAQPLDAFVNSGNHEVHLASHEIFNDRRWKGFMPKDLVATELTARLSLGFAKQLWRQKKGFGGETQYFGGGYATTHTVQEITLDRQTHDLTPGPYVLIGYTDPVFENLFYDLLKPIEGDLMLFRGYTGRFPDGKRGWTAVLLRRYPFGQMGIDDHEVLYTAGTAPSDEQLEGTWKVEALYYQNLPVEIGRVSIDHAPGGGLQVASEMEGSERGLLLPKFVADHFSSAHLDALRSELRVVDDRYLVGRWTTDIRGPYAKFLLAGSRGLFHPEKGRGPKRFTMYYLMTRGARA